MSDQGGSMGSVGSVSVEITGDMAKLNATLGDLPSQVGKKLVDVQKAIKAQLTRNSLGMKDLLKGGYLMEQDKGQYDALGAANERLKARLDTVNASLARRAEVLATVSTQTKSLDTTMPSMSNGIRSTGVAAKNSAYGFLLLSQAVEDSQYGFSAIVNNIPGVAMAFGGGAGLAGAVSIAAVGINQLVKHWDDVAKLWRSEATQKEAERMKLLAKYTEEVVEQQKKLKKEKGEATDKGTSAIADAHKQVGHAGSVSDLAAAIKAAGIGGTDAMNKGNAEALLSRATLGEGPAIDRIKELMSGGAAASSKFGLAMAGKDPGVKPETAEEFKARREEEASAARARANTAEAERDAAFHPTTMAEINAREEEKLHPMVTHQAKQAAAEELARKMKAEKDEAAQVDESAAKAAEAMRNRYLPDFLKGNIEGVSNFGGQQDKIAGDLSNSGMDEEKAKRVAARVVDLMAQEAENRISSRALKGGITPEAAAEKELRDLKLDDIAKRKAEMKKVGEQHQSSIMDITGYLNSLQSSGFFKGGDDASLKESKTHTELLKEIAMSTKKKTVATFGKRGG